MKKYVNWGIVGCGGIANKFLTSSLDVDNVKVVAVASNTPGKAEAFAKKYNIEKFYTDYASLLANPDVDAVYIATTHNFHYKNAKQVLEAGKHILCEKPFTVNSRELRSLISIAKSENLFMMEAMWTRFLPAIVQLRKWIEDGEIGEIKHIKASFGFSCPFDPSSRLYNIDLAGGALLDAGIYPLSFTNMLLKERPVEIKAIAEIGETGVDEQSSYILKYRNGAMGILNSAVNTPMPSSAEILGKKGRIFIPQQFLSATEVILEKEGCEPITRIFNFDPPKGFKFEIQAATDSILNGEKENKIMPLTDSLQLIEIIDEIKKQLGLVYANDREII